MPVARLRAVRAKVDAVARHVTEFVHHNQDALAAIDPRFRDSAENLLAYVGLRQLDLRALQLELGEWGLSSLGRCEGHVVPSLDELLARIDDALAAHGEASRATPLGPGTSRATSERLLHEHTEALLGPTPDERHVRILVTAPDVPPTEEECARLLRAGMNATRINTAHGAATAWRQTAERVRRVAERMDRSVRILVDLEGPKLRTATIDPGPAVARYHPEKNAWGHVVHALRVPVVGVGAPVLGGGVAPLRVPDAWIAELRVGDVLAARDTRGRNREFRIAEAQLGAAVAELDRTCYLGDGTEIRWLRGGDELDRHTVRDLPPVPGYVQLRVGDTFLLRLEPVEGHPGSRNPVDGTSWLVPPHLGLEAEGIDVDVRPQQRIYLDDGKVEAVVEAVDGRVATARVVHTTGEAVKIRGEKGVNFPDTEVRASALSAKDEDVLPSVVEIADAVGISFVRTPADLREAMTAIAETAGTHRPGIVVKLETAQALRNLPGILLEAMRHHPVGVMIARGDLAVEVGFERLAELQQEILWFAEAAHLPVIWATQVLDNLARTGIPSRAEITDASMSAQAECVMLNKGAHVVEACQTLSTIICEMEQHQFKKRNLYRPLQISLAMGTHPTPDCEPPYSR